MSRTGTVAEPQEATSSATRAPEPQALVRIPERGPESAIVDLDGFLLGGLTARYAEWGSFGGSVLLTGESPFVEVSGWAGFGPDGALDGSVNLKAWVNLLGLGVADVTWAVSGWAAETPLAMPAVTLVGTRLSIEVGAVGSEVEVQVAPGFTTQTDGSALLVDLPAGSAGEGIPLEPRIAELLGGLLGADLSALRLHLDSDLGQQDQGAKAFSAGADLFFAPAAYDLANPDGAQLLETAVRQSVAGVAGPVVLSAGLADPASSEIVPPTSAPAAPPLPDACTVESVTPEAAPAEAVADQAVDEGGPSGEVVGEELELPVAEGEEQAGSEVELIMPEAPSEPPPAQAARMGGVGGSAGRAGGAARDLPTADENVGDARGAVTEPAAETAARARAALAEALGERPAPSPEIVALCDRIRTAIRERRPVDEDELTRADPEEAAREAGQSVDTTIQSQADSVDESYEDMNNPSEGSPVLTPTPVEDPAPTAPGMDTPASTAAPDAISDENLSLDGDRDRVDQQIEESRIERHSTEPIQEDPFTTVREGRAELGEMAETSPAELAAQQAQAIATAETDMAALQQSAVAALNAARGGTVAGVSTGQSGMVVTEQVTRESVSAEARRLFDTAQTQVNNLLEPLTRTAMARWDAGVARLSTEFRQTLDRVQRWIDERHSGVGGFFVAGWDAVTGLPRWVTDEYDRAERRFGEGVCELLLSISTDVNGVIAAAEAVIQQARDDIHTLFDNLPADLQEWATQERANFTAQLDGLGERVQQAQTSFVEDVSRRATEAVAEVQAEVERRREEAKGVIGKIADAIEAFIDDPVKAIINGLLTLVGIPPGAFWALVDKIQQVIADIADDPESFINNLVAGLKQGFQQFFDNFGTHVLNGFWDWLFSGLGSVGVQLPPDSSVGSLVTFALQVMGITWPRIREILVRHVGEENVQIIETVWEIVSTLIVQGPQGIFEMIKQRLDPATIVQTILQAAVDYLIETLITQVVVRVIGMLNPAGAVAQAINLIYQILSWVFRNAARIFRLVETVVNGIADVVAGNIGGFAGAVERALASLVPPVIDFLAGLLGLGGLPLEIANVIGRLQAMVLAVVEELIVWLIERGRALLAALGLGGEDEDDEEEDDGGDDDNELGTTVRFSAGGESHRLWVQLSGEDATLMVASVPEALANKIQGWQNKIAAGEPADEQKRSEASGLLGQLGPMADLADQEGDALAAQFIAAAADLNDDIKPPSDDALENRERAIAGVLARLFDLFGEQHDEAAILADIAAHLPPRAGIYQTEVHQGWMSRISTFTIGNEPNDDRLWTDSVLTGTESSAIGYTGQQSTHRSLLPYFTTAPGDRSADTGAFQDYAFVSTGAPHTVRRGFRQSLGNSALAALKAQATSNISSNTKVDDRYKERLQARVSQITFEWDSPGGGRFTLPTERIPDHTRYRPESITSTESGGVRTVKYRTVVGQEFTSTTDSNNGLEMVVEGLGLQMMSGRGVTEDSPWFTSGQGFNRAHLIANEFGGSGYANGANLATTSAEYNQQVMRGAELMIGASIRRFAEQKGIDKSEVTFNLTVRVRLGALRDPAALAQIKQRLPIEAGQRDLDAEITQKINAGEVHPDLMRVTSVNYSWNSVQPPGLAGGTSIGADLWLLVSG